MARLSISFLDPQQALLGDEILPSFRTNKVQALLISLAAEPIGPHRCEKLMTLLWEESARLNLCQNLYHRSRTIPELPAQEAAVDPTVLFLLSDRNTVDLNPAADYEVDARRFSELIGRTLDHEHLDFLSCSDCHKHLILAVALDLLETLTAVLSL